MSHVIESYYSLTKLVIGKTKAFINKKELAFVETVQSYQVVQLSSRTTSFAKTFYMSDDDREDSYTLISANLSGDYVILFQTFKVSGTATASSYNSASGVGLYLHKNSKTAGTLATNIDSSDKTINKTFDYTLTGSTDDPATTIYIKSMLLSSPSGGTARCTAELECTLISYGVKFS